MGSLGLVWKSRRLFAKRSRSALDAGRVPSPQHHTSANPYQGSPRSVGSGTDQRARSVRFQRSPLWLPKARKATITLHFLATAQSSDPTLQRHLISLLAVADTYGARPPASIARHSISLPFAGCRLSASSSDIGCSPGRSPPRLADRTAPPAANTLLPAPATFHLFGALSSSVCPAYYR